MKSFRLLTYGNDSLLATPILAIWTSFGGYDPIRDRLGVWGFEIRWRWRGQWTGLRRIFSVAGSQKYC